MSSGRRENVLWNVDNVGLMSCGRKFTFLIHFEFVLLMIYEERVISSVLFLLFQIGLTQVANVKEHNLKSIH